MHRVTHDFVELVSIVNTLWKDNLCSFKKYNRVKLIVHKNHHTYLEPLYDHIDFLYVRYNTGSDQGDVVFIQQFMELVHLLMKKKIFCIRGENYLMPIGN